VMKAFGGEVRCESALGQFTEFSLRFPPIGEDARQAYRAAVLEAARVALLGKRLLLVEDDAAQRVTTRHKLRPLGLVVDEAADGQRALELMARHAYDVVLLDLHMPVLDGYQVALRVRQGQVPANRYVRIVAHTSEPAHVARVKTQRAGMEGFLGKPCAQLPLAQALQGAVEGRGGGVPQGHPLAGRRVLLADDSSFNRRAVAAYLREAGATVDEVDHGMGVLEQLEAQGGFDVVLMDLNMPGLDGLAAARTIRGSGRPWAAVPVVALTAHSDPASFDAARQAGMDGFLVKPVEASLLVESIAQLLAAAPRAPRTDVAPPPPAPEADGPLLNVGRLDSYRRLGLLEELLGDYLPEIRRLLDVLGQAVQGRELQQAQDALHSLLGMSGEAGALALYQRVRRIYVPVLEERRWPEGPDWLLHLRLLAERTEEALREYGASATPID
jgi:two-component system CAI-1 autoinducer sensor kinase/phosphatase CqsS